MGATDFGNPDHVIHIPARDLRGTRNEKLADLDLLLTQLQVVRLALLGQVVDVDGAADCNSHPGNAVPPGTPGDEDR